MIMLGIVNSYVHITLLINVLMLYPEMFETILMALLMYWVLMLYPEMFETISMALLMYWCLFPEVLWDHFDGETAL